MIDSYNPETSEIKYVVEEVADLDRNSDNEEGTNHSGNELSLVAETEGFEPSIRFPVYTLSRRASSTTRASLRFQPGFPA